MQAAEGLDEIIAPLRVGQAEQDLRDLVDAIGEAARLGVDEPPGEGPAAGDGIAGKGGQTALELVGDPLVEFVEAVADGFLARRLQALALRLGARLRVGIAAASTASPAGATNARGAAPAAAGFALSRPDPRRRPIQSSTHCGRTPGANPAPPSAPIHISASACLQGNLRLGQVHLLARSASPAMTR
jgi:hypothetical protein